MAILKPPFEVQRLDIFRCPVCRKDYPTRKQAEECLAQGVEQPIVKVGDIVNMGYGYGWFDGDVRWVINPSVRKSPGPDPSPAARPCPKKKGGSCFDSCCSMGFYYVVTEVDHCEDQPHRTRYHVFTKAMTGERRPMGGYTYNGGAGTPELVKKPKPFLVKSSASLIGLKAEHLI